MRALLLFAALAAFPCAPAHAQSGEPGGDPADDPTIPAPPGEFGRPSFGLFDAEGRPLEPMMLWLRDGGILWGAIEAHDPDYVTYLRLDTGGRVTLPWGLLDPEQEGQLRLRFGYVEVEVEEILINAQRIPLVDGTELVGLVVNYSDDALYVKNATTTFPLPKNRIAGPAVVVQVPALDIYTREELYQQKLAETAPRLALEGPDSAPAHLEVAEYCERFFDYAHATEHYLLAERADPNAITSELAQRAARAAEKALVQEQVDILAEADRWRAKKKFDLALEMVAEVPERFPDSPLLEDVYKLRERILRAQDKALQAEVVKAWHSRTARIAAEVARELGYGEALSYAQGQMSEDIAEAVAQDLEKLQAGITADDVRQRFALRKTYKRYKASYGIATWFLGTEAAQKQLEEQEEEETSGRKTEKDDARSQLEAKIKKYIENSSRGSGGGAGGGGRQGEEDDPEEHWKQMTSAARTQWVRAYYAEHSGDMIVTAVRLSPCVTCAASGGIEIIQAGGAGNQGSNTATLRFEPCPTCHTVQYVRRITYK
jgi:hypothetical protein